MKETKPINPEEEKICQHFHGLRGFGFVVMEKIYSEEGRIPDLVEVETGSRFYEMYLEGKPVTMARRRSDGEVVIYEDLHIGYSHDQGKQVNQ